MNLLKKWAAIGLSAVLFAVVPNSNVLKANADSPETYLIYLDNGEWEFQIGSSEYDPEATSYAADRIMADNPERVPRSGDTVVIRVIDPDNGTPGCTIDLGSIQLSNLTVANVSPTVVIKCGYIQDCYILTDTNAAINANVQNAYVYDRANANFNNDVTNLYISSDKTDDAPDVNVKGTVGYAKYTTAQSLEFEYYAFVKDSFNLEDEGKLTTNTNYYTADGNGPLSASAAPSATPAPATPTPAAPAAPTNNSALDDVPKTGECAVPAYVWFFGAASLCYVLKRMLKRA